MSSSRTSRSSTLSVIVAATSSRTGGPNRRRASSRSRACSRSSSRSSSTSSSALRVTRNRWCSTICMPEKSWSRCAAISSSTGRNRARRVPSGATPRLCGTVTKRGTLLGTLIRANSSGPPSGSRTTTARLSDRPEMYGNGCAGSTASGVSTGKTCSRKYARSRSRFGRVELVPADESGCRLGRQWPDATSLVKQAECRPTRSAVRSAIRSELLARGEAIRRPAPAGRSAGAA